MISSEILERVENAKADFGTKTTKFTGAATEEAIRKALKEAGIPVSGRDVFIKGVPIEIDLLIPKPGVDVDDRILFAPDEVLFALEIKNFGSFGQATIDGVSKSFGAIKTAAPAITCVYLTLAERETYSWRVTDENIPGRVFMIFWYDVKGNRGQYHDSHDWERFLQLVSTKLARR